SLTNWQTGNVLTKSQVIDSLESVQIVSDEAGRTLDMFVYRDAADELALLVVGDDTEPYMAIPRGPREEPSEDAAVDLSGVTIDPESPPETVGEYELLGTLQVAGVANRIQGQVIDLPDGSIGNVETLNSVRVRSSGRRFVYDPETDTIRDNQEERTCTAGPGSFFCDAVPEEDVAGTAIASTRLGVTCTDGLCDNVPLFAIDERLTGWRTVIGLDNYTSILENQRIRAPFLRVFTWNVFFAGASVVLTFAMGLGLAMVLKDEGMRGRSFYRSAYIIPYAIPGFLSILVWRGLMNAQFGKVNGLLETFGIPGPDWLGDPYWAMFAVLLVNLWLGFPYMFMISSGALTSIPEDLLEAARVDGASAWRVFRSITLPLLLVSTAPLLIGAFAFNFNNFVLVFLLNRGGPPLTGYDVPVGATDLLISFTFNLAQGAGRGNQFGLSSAIIVLIFIVLATASASSFRLTKRLEEVYDQ
ncbi:MAG: ABC transporter permease subunit, partial [Acidimicrobiia bacterium]|nr:ABC transporter permease subunit [Acidimicrobiia bacterium]